jgi:hypothetical protein
MATSTRTRRNQPETDTPDTPAEENALLSSPTTDDLPESDLLLVAGIEGQLLLPADYEPNHPTVGALLDMVKWAEEHKDDPTPIADFVAAADKLFKLPNGFEVALKAPEGASERFSAFKTDVDALREHVETVNREDGDNLADGLKALVKVPMGGITDEADKAAIPIIVARWFASAPKGASGSGSGSRGESSIPALTYPNGDRLRVEFHCGSCKKKFSTRKDNLNSARREIIKHMVRAHPAQNKQEKWDEGTESYKAVTEGFFLTGLSNGKDRASEDQLVDSIQRGEWTFKRTGG